MATINGQYIFVETEEVSYGVDATEHTVESGIAISDHVKKKAIEISLSGEIVGKNASSVLSKLREAHQSGAVCKYAGKVSLSNCLILDFSIGTSYKVWGGYTFSMTLRQIRTAKTSYVAPKTTKTSTQQTTAKSTETWVYHTVKKGDTIWALVAASKAPYKSLSRPAINGKSYSACDWVMAKNQSAFSRKGDFGTLQIGKKIIVGLRNGSASSSGSAKATTSSSKNKNKVTQYHVTVRITGTSSCVHRVVITYTQYGKAQNKTIKERCTSCGITADAGTMVQVVAEPKPNCKCVFNQFSGDTWKKISAHRQRIEKLSKNSSTTVYFYK